MGKYNKPIEETISKEKESDWDAEKLMSIANNQMIMRC